MEQTNASTNDQAEYQKLPGFVALLEESTRLYKLLWKPLVKLELISWATTFGAYVLMLAAVLAAAAATSGLNNATAIIGALIFIAGGIGICLLLAWFAAAAIIVLRDKQVGITVRESTNRAKPYVLPYALLSLLSFLIIFAGGILLIIPAIIFAIWFMFWEYALIVENKKGFAAFKKSREYARGYFWDIFLLCALAGIAMIAVNMVFQGISYIPLGGLVSMAASAIITPFYSVFFYLMFYHLKKIKLGEATTTSIPDKPNKPLALGLSVVGLVAALAIVAIAVYYGPQIKEQVRLQFDKANLQYNPGIRTLPLESI